MIPNKDADRFPRSRRPRWLLPAIAAAILLAVGVASAGASSSIEGVWAFENGQIAVHPLPNGTFAGTVVEATKFAECAHPVGQQIWTNMRAQPDGSYWGYHQWYFEQTCVLNPTLGPTAWRVLEEPNRSKYVLVCLSSPGASQPTIAANGSDSGATYGCVKSSLTAPLPSTSNSRSTPKSGAAGRIERLSLPSAKKCLSARRFQIHLREPRYDPFKNVLVTIKGRKIATARKGDYVIATINLKGLKRGAFTVTIHATTVLGHHLSSRRTYHTCAKKAKRTKPAKLH